VECATPRSSDLGTILLVEDNPDDVFMVSRAFKQVGIVNPLVVVRDGQQAIQYLKGEGLYVDRQQFPVPDLMLLDLDLPGVNGFQVLTWLRRESDCRHVPVVVLTSSTYSPDVKRAYQVGANTFLTKPTDFIELVSEVKAVGDFWLNQRGMDAPIGGSTKRVPTQSTAQPDQLRAA